MKFAMVTVPTLFMDVSTLAHSYIVLLDVVFETSPMICLQGPAGRDGIPGHSGSPGDTVSWQKIMRILG